MASSARYNSSLECCTWWLNSPGDVKHPMESQMLTKILGAAMLLTVFGGMFLLMAKQDGFQTTALIWAAAIATTAFIVVGLLLLLGAS